MYLKLLILIVAVLQVVAAGVLSLNTFEESTRAFPVYIQPAGWAFSIWGLIYLLSFVYAVYQLIPKNDNALLQKTRMPAVIGFAGSIVWLYFAGATDWQIWLTVPTLMLMAFFFTVVIRAKGDTASPRQTFFSQSILFPYAAWTGIAFWLNVQTVMISEGLVTSSLVNVLSNAALLVGIILFTAYYFKKSNYSWWYGGVLVWASIGVIVANLNNGSLLFGAATGLYGATVAGVLLWRQITHPLPIIR